MYKKLMEYLFHRRPVKSTVQADETYDKILKMAQGQIEKYNLDIERVTAELKVNNDEIAELRKINAMLKEGKLDEFEEALLKDKKLIEDIENMQKQNSENGNEEI